MASSGRALLKVDTRGHDLAVVAGAGRWLGRVSLIQLEASLKAVYDGAPQLVEVIPHLQERGFEVTGMFPVAGTPGLRLIEVDCVLGRPP